MGMRTILQSIPQSLIALIEALRAKRVDTDARDPAVVEDVALATHLANLPLWAGIEPDKQELVVETIRSAVPMRAS